MAERFAITIRPRASETDLLGHINNTVFAVWFEELRSYYLMGLREADDSLPLLSVAVASLTIDYLAEAWFGHEVSAEISGVEVGNTSMVIRCEMFQKGQVVARASAVLVHWDPETRRPTRIGDAWRERLARDA